MNNRIAMYAIVEMAGQQFKVAKDQKVFVHRLSAEEGNKVTFDKVLLLDDGTNVTIGTPVIEDISVEGKVLRHLKGDKVVVFKKKRRKGYKVKNGHRQLFTEILIENIGESHKEEIASKEKIASQEEVVSEKKTASKKEEKTIPEKKDDLKKIEGIGPKIANIFNTAGIHSFADLAKATVEELKEILAEAGSTYASKNPTFWPKQAKMAAEGKWKELKEWQDNAKGGVEKK